jgi:cytochrome c oxidase accessory protein FixG
LQNLNWHTTGPSDLATGNLQNAPADKLSQDESTEQSLYEIRKKVYPRAVRGFFAGWRWLLVWATQLVFFCTPWLSWTGRQAVLFDLASRKFYIFGLVLWPQDIVYLTILLIICAYSLFLFTAVAGRLWCGYACPQTVYTEIFLWIERKIEGDRAARMRLDKTALGWRKFGLKAAKHTVWGTLALWTGFTFVGYFTPISTLASEVGALATGPWETFWILFYGFATYGNAGWMREQVCKYMCPYARFQSAMFDSDTLIITYDPTRGEPRGSRRRGTKPEGHGDCVDCNICVQVCPTGIDIRNGLQYECIGCAACIDGCNQVMDKMGYPRGLIRYSSENAMRVAAPERSTLLRRVFRPRVLVYTVILWAIIVAAAITLYQRIPLKLDVIRDRVTLAHDDGDAVTENVYRMQIMNTTEHARRLVIAVEGIEKIGISGGEVTLDLPPASTRTVPVRVRTEGEHTRKGSNRIYFTLRTIDNLEPPLAVKEKAAFIVP